MIIIWTINCCWNAKLINYWNECWCHLSKLASLKIYITCLINRMCIFFSYLLSLVDFHKWSINDHRCNLKAVILIKFTTLQLIKAINILLYDNSQMSTPWLHTYWALLKYTSRQAFSVILISMWYVFRKT